MVFSFFHPKLYALEYRFNRGFAEEALIKFLTAENDYRSILDQESENAAALYNLGNVQGIKGDWKKAEPLFQKALLAQPDFVMARSSYALALYQNGKVQQAEYELRNIIRRYPMFADARAALSAILWKKGFLGEAESHWTAAVGLDDRYEQSDWLLDIRRWPPDPIKDLQSFLSLESP